MYTHSVNFDFFFHNKTYLHIYIYLSFCLGQGLERIVVNSGCASAAPTTAEATGSVGGGGAGDAGPGAGAVVTPQLRHKIEKLALELLKMENEKFSIPALKLLLSCMYVGKYWQRNRK